LSIYGGKITTFRRLAEEAVDKVCAALAQDRPAWTATAPLPGGDMDRADFAAFVGALGARWPWLPAPLLRRLARAYGTRIEALIGDAHGLRDLGPEVVPGLYAAEIEYLVRYEFARTAADILWRRSKLGLHLPRQSEAVLDQWLEAHQNLRQPRHEIAQ
jgi:glycerol-3-phosphate dehydrogenase